MKINNGAFFNIAFWLLYFLYQWAGLASLYGRYDSYFINACMALPVSLAFSVLTVQVFFKRDFTHAGRLSAWMGTIFSSAVLLLIRRYVNHEFIYPRYFPQALQVPFFSFGKLLVELVNLYVVAALYALYYFIRTLYQQRNRTLELLQQKTRAELDSLTAQVQPHFVFNTLNNIYSTALTDSPETAELISHLSGLLDYNLYQSSHDRVALATEIEYLEHYLELQKNRYGDKLEVNFEHSCDISGFQLAPLLFLPLVENSFKHGVSLTLKRSWLRIAFSREKNFLFATIENSKAQNVASSGIYGGIGIANVKKRLELIYSGAHEISFDEDQHSYRVNVKLKNLQNG